MRVLSRGSLRNRSGQTMIFLVIILVILVFIVLWNFDLHKIFYVKFLSQTAGDAAAMAAARWQGVSLNLIGDLNIVRGMALSDAFLGGRDTAAAAAIGELQARLCYVGPMIGMMFSQQAAKNNRIHNNAEFTEYLRAHVDKIRYVYPRFIIEAYPGCLEEYADMLKVICDNGIAAGPESMRLYTDYEGDHLLLDKDFYDAVATRSWCWFFFNAYDLLRNYSGYTDWDPLPAIMNPWPINSEFFSLRLKKEALSPDDIARIIGSGSLTVDRALPGMRPGDPVVLDTSAVWYRYDSSWHEPFPMAEVTFPAAGPVKPQYNYFGADAVARIETEPDLRTPGTKINNITWTTAAKPFGYLNRNDPPCMYGIVFPAFHEAALIPVDASGGASGGSFDLAWRKHIEEHLPDYVAHGPRVLHSGCWYCAQIRAWDNRGFRNDGLHWLAANSDTCYGSGAGGGGAGGTRRGH